MCVCMCDEYLRILIFVAEVKKWLENAITEKIEERNYGSNTPFN